jgi:hypothetical protein
MTYLNLRLEARILKWRLEWAAAKLFLANRWQFQELSYEEVLAGIEPVMAASDLSGDVYIDLDCSEVSGFKVRLLAKTPVGERIVSGIAEYS